MRSVLVATSSFTTAAAMPAAPAKPGAPLPDVPVLFNPAKDVAEPGDGTLVFSPMLDPKAFNAGVPPDRLRVGVYTSRDITTVPKDQVAGISPDFYGSAQVSRAGRTSIVVALPGVAPETAITFAMFADYPDAPTASAPVSTGNASPVPAPSPSPSPAPNGAPPAASPSTPPA